MFKKIIILLISIITIVISLFFFFDIEQDDINASSNNIVYSVDNISTNLEKASELTSRDSDIICATSIGLVNKDDNGNIVPSLAKSINISDDGIEYNFEISDNLYWSDGSKITAQDIINFFKDLLLVENEESIFAILDIYGAYDYRINKSDFDTTVAINSEGSNIKIRLNKQNDNFLNELTKPIYRLRDNLSLWNNIIENYKNIKYSGAYNISYLSNERIVLSSNDKSKLNIEFIKDENKELAMAAFEISNRDIILDPPKSQVLRLDEEDKLLTFSQDKGLYVRLNDNLSLDERKTIYKYICSSIEKFQEENTSRILLAEGSYFIYDMNDLVKLQNRKVNTNRDGETVEVSNVLTLFARDDEDSRDIGRYFAEYFKKYYSIDLTCSFVGEDEFNDRELQKRYDLVLNTLEYNKENIDEFFYDIKLIINEDDESNNEVDYELYEEEIFNSYRFLPICFINRHIAVSSNISNIDIDSNGNIDLSKLEK